MTTVPAADTTVAPDGTTTADTLTMDAGVNSRVLQHAINAAGTYTFSVWVKAATGTKDFRLRTWSAAEGFITASLTATTNWQRFSVTATVSVVGLVVISNDAAFTAGTLELWGAQLESLPFSSSYIPTTTAAVTRATDNLMLSLSGNYPSVDNLSIIADAQFKTLNGEDNIYRINQSGMFNQADSYQWLRRLNGNVHAVTGGNLAGATVAGVSVDAVHRLSMVVGGGSITAGLDGKLGNPTPNIGIGIPTVAIGIAPFSFSIYIRNFRIYDQALTASEIAAA